MTSRRKFLTSLVQAGAAVPLWARSTFAQGGATPLRAIARPTPEQVVWQDLEIGMFVHFAPNTWQDLEYDNRSTPLSAMQPDINTDQWADCAVALGAKYIVFVAKHAGGFCMWQTQTADYSIRSLAWKGGRGDVMADLAASCRKRGLKLGVYLSPRDDTHGAAGGGVCKTPQQQEAYNAIYRQQLTELLTRYGPLVEIWFDGSIVVPVRDILIKNAIKDSLRSGRYPMVFQGPHATIRWVGNEDGFAPYPAWNSIDRGDARTGIATAAHSDPLGDTWLPNEVDVSMRRPNWFWHTDNAKNLLSLDALLEIYYRSVGRGAQLLLNFTPDRRGWIPEGDSSRASEFGREIQRRFGKSLAETSGSADSLVLSLPGARRIDHVILQEDLVQGERVREYRIEGREGKNWIPLGTGSAIGHKRIQPVVARMCEALRLVSVHSAGLPRIRRFAAFETGATPPPQWDAPASVWADDDVGRWRNGTFELDVTKKVAAAGDYRLRCTPVGVGEAQIQEISASVDGAPEPRALRRASGRNEVMILSLAKSGQRVVLRGRVGGAASGMVLLRKL